MDNQLMLGILLIIVGVALGLIAVAVVLNRREERISAEVDLDAEHTDDEEPSDTEEKEPAELAEEQPPKPEEDEPPDEDDGDSSPSEAGEPEQMEPPAPRERRLVAEIYREEVTGKLIVRAGDQEYSDGKQIENEAERRRLAYAASDLADWFQGEFELGGQSTAPAAQEPASSDHMLEEIDRILQRSLVGKPDRGVRLIPDGGGGVKALIGVKSYMIEDVPDDEIKDLIRQAVAEWEADQ